MDILLFEVVLFTAEAQLTFFKHFTLRNKGSKWVLLKGPFLKKNPSSVVLCKMEGLLMNHFQTENPFRNFCMFFFKALVLRDPQPQMFTCFQNDTFICRSY